MKHHSEGSEQEYHHYPAPTQLLASNLNTNGDSVNGAPATRKFIVLPHTKITKNVYINVSPLYVISLKMTPLAVSTYQLTCSHIGR